MAAKVRIGIISTAGIAQKNVAAIKETDNAEVCNRVIAVRSC